ncbi:MAG TPA: FeoB small GTPase domain-containing protein, partial [Candidatus Obscuribacter sp.]|nr:FeoB small GTPase domain-containing protein [Candidatus Obscuribacter sp.]
MASGKSDKESSTGTQVSSAGAAIEATRGGLAVQSSTSQENQVRNIVLAGNPNVGKSVIFNALTGANADVSNYPGTTIDIAKGKLGKDDLADTPGVYGVSSFNDEERTASKMILNADLVINVVSALTLERDLFLTLQLIEMGKPLLLVVNQSDEARARGLKLDLAVLEATLGVKVIPCVAVENQGIDDIKHSLADATTGNACGKVLEILEDL